MVKYLLIFFYFFSQAGLAQNGEASFAHLAAHKSLPQFSARLATLRRVALPGKGTLWPLATQQIDSILPNNISSKKIAFNRKVIAPALLVGFGFLTLGNPEFLESNEAVQQEITWHYPQFHTDLDDYTRYAPLAAVYGLNLAGVKGRNNLLNLTLLYALSGFINNTLTKNIKNLTGSRRPDATSLDAFPSGHTSTAFSNAELMHQEFKHLSAWYSVGGYSFAAATGALRMLNNRHWLSDIMAGAGIGILSTRLAYVIYPWVTEKIKFGNIGPDKVIVVPMYQQGNYGLTLGLQVDHKKHASKK